MKIAPLVSVTIPIWNKNEATANLSRRAVASLLNYVQTPFELILVDNDSPDQSFLREALPELLQAAASSNLVQHQVVRLSRNQGFGRACNVGLALACGSFFAQMNTDAELVEDSVTLLVEQIRIHGLGVAMPEHFENSLHYGLGKSNELMVDWRFGAFFIAQTDIMRAVNGYDPLFELCYWEDTDLWKRIEASGHRVAGWRGTWVSHWGGASTHPDRDAVFEANSKRFEERWGK